MTDFHDKYLKYKTKYLKGKSIYTTDLDLIHESEQRSAEFTSYGIVLQREEQVYQDQDNLRRKQLDDLTTRYSLVGYVNKIKEKYNDKLKSIRVQKLIIAMGDILDFYKCLIQLMYEKKKTQYRVSIKLNGVEISVGYNGRYEKNEWIIKYDGDSETIYQKKDIDITYEQFINALESMIILSYDRYVKNLYNKFILEIMDILYKYIEHFDVKDDQITQIISEKMYEFIDGKIKTSLMKQISELQSLPYGFSILINKINDIFKLIEKPKPNQFILYYIDEIYKNFKLNIQDITVLESDDTGRYLTTYNLIIENLVKYDSRLITKGEIQFLNHMQDIVNETQFTNTMTIISDKTSEILKQKLKDDTSEIIQENISDVRFIKIIDNFSKEHKSSWYIIYGKYISYYYGIDLTYLIFNRILIFLILKNMI